MFRHVTSITWTEQSTAQERAHAIEQLRTLPSVVPEIRSLEVGEDLGLRPGNASIVCIVDFDDQDGFLRYRENPDHLAVGVTMRPIVAASVGVQFRR